MVPSEKTDFPDTRNKSAIHSVNGSCMVIPREGDKIRVYIQLSDTDAVDRETGRVNLGRYGPERLLEVAKKTFKPYTIDAVPDKIEWWTIYQSKNPHFAGLKSAGTVSDSSLPSRAASRLKLHRQGASFYRWRRLPHTFSESRSGYECQYE
jgi:hypothetical protein